MQQTPQPRRNELINKNEIIKIHPKHSNTITSKCPKPWYSIWIEYDGSWCPVNRTWYTEKGIKRFINKMLQFYKTDPWHKENIKKVEVLPIEEIKLGVQ